MLYNNRYLYWLSMQGVLITNIVKNSTTATDIIANIIIGTFLISHWPFSNQFQHLADQNMF